MKIRFLFLGCLSVIIMMFTGALADVDRISPFDYSFIEPTASDLSQKEAESIADAYFSSNSNRILIKHEEVAQYTKVSHFIRIVKQEHPVYCWVVAYNDGKNLFGLYGFVGMVIVSSPDGRIIDYSDADYWQCFSQWEDQLATGQRSRVEVRGMVDLIAFPEDHRIKHIMPDMYTISEAEAHRTADRLIAGYQHIAEEDVAYDYAVTIKLDRNLLVSDFPIWSFSYCSYKDTQTEGTEIGRL